MELKCWFTSKLIAIAKPRQLFGCNAVHMASPLCNAQRRGRTRKWLVRSAWAFLPNKKCQICSGLMQYRVAIMIESLAAHINQAHILFICIICKWLDKQHCSATTTHTHTRPPPPPEYSFFAQTHVTNFDVKIHIYLNCKSTNVRCIRNDDTRDEGKKLAFLNDK